MFCKECGNKIKDDASFCSKCGQKTAAKIKEEKIEQIQKNIDIRFKKELFIFIPVMIVVVLLVIILN